MLGEILGYLFFCLPVLGIVFFLVSLWDYRKANRGAQVDPDSIAKERLRGKRILTIVLGIIAGCMTLGMVGLIALVYMAVAFM